MGVEPFCFAFSQCAPKPAETAPHTFGPHSIARTHIFLNRIFVPDADELEWYIPAGINLPDLQLPLTVIEQFEKSPLDLNGKRASQLLQKRRGRRRHRRRRQPSSSDSDSEGGNSDPDAPRKAARKARERETYKSAQFIEDSEEEYGRDIDAFFAREAELRKRTALSASAAAAAEGQQGQEEERRHRHLGTMRATGTKKRRRAQQPARGTSVAPRARAAKRRAVVSLSGTPGKDGEGEHGGINAVAAAPRRGSLSPAAASFDDDDDGGGDYDYDDDDGGGGGEGGDSGDDDDAERSSIVDRDATGRHRHSGSLEASKSHRPPRARPLYRRGTSLRASPAPDAMPSTPGADGGEEEEDDTMGPRPSMPSLRVADEDDLTRETKGGGGANNDGGGSGGGSGLRKGRLIISDEEE